MSEPVLMFGIEVLVIGVIVILLFGASRIPKVANAVGQATGAFKQGKEESEKQVEELREDVEKDLKGEDDEAETETEPRR